MYQALGAAKAPVTAVVQPAIQYERRGQGGGSGPARGIVYGARREISRWQRAMQVGVVQ